MSNSMSIAHQAKEFSQQQDEETPLGALAMQSAYNFSGIVADFCCSCSYCCCYSSQFHSCSRFFATLVVVVVVGFGCYWFYFLVFCLVALHICLRPAWLPAGMAWRGAGLGRPVLQCNRQAHFEQDSPRPHTACLPLRPPAARPFALSFVLARFTEPVQAHWPCIVLIFCGQPFCSSRKSGRERERGRGRGAGMP